MPRVPGPADFERTLWYSEVSPMSPVVSDASADIIVVGAGLSGLSAALHLVQAGHDVMLIEAREPGFGASGRNAAGCVPMWLARLPSEVETALGSTTGGRLNRLLSQAPARLAELVEQHDIRCGLSRRGASVVAHTEKAALWIERLVAEWNGCGGSVRHVSQRQLGRVHGYAGAVFEEALTLNPLDLVRGLAELFVALGGRLHSRTPAISMSRTLDGWNVSTPQCELHARRVIVATEGYAANRTFLPKFERGCMPVTMALVATAPLSDIAKILPDRQPIADTNRVNPLWVMADSSNRLLVSLLPPRSRERTADWVGVRAERRIRRLLPDLPRLRWEYYWEGEIALSAAGLPYFVELDDGVVGMGGYNGQGILPAFVAGREIARSMDGASDIAIPFKRAGNAAMRPLAPWLFRQVVFPLARILG